MDDAEDQCDHPHPSAAIVIAVVVSTSRITNLRLMASKAISSTVLTWTTLSRRNAARTMECLNSMAMSTVKMEPKSAWNIV